MAMRVVLLTDVKGSGKKGDVVEVKDGYARNYLLPKGFARVVTDAIQRELAEQQARAMAKESRERAKQQETCDALNGRTIEISAHVGEQGRLFGAVTHADVAEALLKLGFTVDKKRVDMDPIKHIGEHNARLHLYPGIDAEIVVHVVEE